MNKINWNVKDYCYHKADRNAFFRIESINGDIATIKQCDNLQYCKQLHRIVNLSELRTNYIEGV